MSSTLASQNPLSYMGVKPPNPPDVIQDNRAPTTLDTNFDVGTEWVDTTAIMVYFLADVSGNTATWIPLGGGAVDVQSLRGNSGGFVFPTAGNIDVVGDAASGIDVVGNPGTSTLTIFNTTGLPFSQIDVDANTPPGTDPVVPTAGGAVTITGGQTAPGTIANVIQTDSLAANSFTIEIQQTSVNALEDTTLNGVAHFNSTQFTNSNGFISIIGSGPALTATNVDASTPPGTNPVLSDASGEITITGGQIAAGSTVNVIQTDSLAANTFTIEIQRSETQAVSTVGSNGVCHFNSADFTVDANGFVSIASSGMTWIDEGAGILLTANNGYFITAAVTETLPAAPSQGDTIKIICDHAGPIVITANAGQTISLGTISSSVAGTFTNTALGDSLELFFRAATSDWKALNSVGTWVAA